MMRVVDGAVAAMDAHRGVAVVAENGLGFLWNVSIPEPNRVRRQAMDLFVVLWGGGWCLATRVWWLASMYGRGNALIPQLFAPCWSHVTASVVINDCMVVAGVWCRCR